VLVCFAGSEDVSCCAVDHIAACEELGFRHTWGMRRTYLMKHMMRDVQTIFQPMTKECPDEPVFLVVVGSVGWDILHSDGHTRNCWKPVVLDRPLKPSSGITFVIYAATQISSGLLSEFTVSRFRLEISPSIPVRGQNYSRLRAGGCCQYHAALQCRHAILGAEYCNISTPSPRF
jgi:hypothetical protein